MTSELRQALRLAIDRKVRERLGLDEFGLLAHSPRHCEGCGIRYGRGFRANCGECMERLSRRRDCKRYAEPQLLETAA